MKLDIQLFAASTTITKTIKDSYNNSYTVTATINESLPSDYITTNKTLLSGTVTVSNTGSGGAYTSNKAMSATLTFRKNDANGEVLTSATGSCKFDFQGSATKTATPLTYNNLEIIHNVDGTRTVYVLLELKITETSLKQTQTYNTTLPLTTIPRASTPTLSDDEVDMGSQITITTNRANSSFTHKLSYSFGNLENQTSGLNQSSNVGESTTFTPSLSLANQIPNSESGACTITCVTYNGSTQTDEYKIGSETVELTLNVPSSVVPTISIGTLAEADDTMQSLNWGIYVQNKSKLSIPITVTPAYSSPTTSSTTANGSTYTTSAVTSATTTTKTTGVLTTTGTNTISATANDNRTRSGTASTTFSVVAYSEPQLTNFDVYRCTSNGTASDEGTYIRYKFNGSVDSVSGNNEHSFVLKYRVKGSTESYTTITTQSGTLSDGKYSVTVPYTVYGSSSTSATNYFSANSAYEFVLEATDSFRTSSNPVRQTKYIETGFDLLNFNNSGKAMAIGKVSEAESDEELLEIALPTNITSPLKINNQKVYACYELYNNSSGSSSVTLSDSVDNYTYLEIFYKINYFYGSTKIYKPTGKTFEITGTVLNSNNLQVFFAQYSISGTTISKSSEYLYTIVSGGTNTKSTTSITGIIRVDGYK